MAKNLKRILVKMKSTGGTGFTYYTKKNKNNSRERLEFKKYDPKLRKHVMFKEEK
jgi:large subunit ribosomal protein L33